MSALQRSAARDPRGLDEALRAIGTLFEQGDVIEIRALNVGRTQDRAGCTYSGYFNSEGEHAIRAALEKLDGSAEGIYVVLNRFNPDLLARSNNRIQARPRNTTSDGDILEWCWLYIDVDALRPPGISATDEEHGAALRKIDAIREFLDGRGWPEPIVADSGNGGHLLYRLPALDPKRASGLVKRCLKALCERFSDGVVKVDESTATAARLCKLYGTMTRKGDSTANRPHRRSALLQTPERIQPVSIEALESLASEVVGVTASAARPGVTASASREFNIDRWLAQSGLEIVKGLEPYNQGRRWLLQCCPFNPEHEKPAVIQTSKGALIYKCLHNSRDENDWRALRRRTEPNYRESVPPSNGGSLTDVPLITDLSQLPSVFTLESKLDWCVEGMIAEGSITLICAESGTGKTWLGYYLAGCVAGGTLVLGRPTRPGKVLYLDGENPAYVVKQRLLDLGITDTPNLLVWGGWNLSPPAGPGNSLVVEFAREHKGLIIFDSLIEFHPGSEQSSTETRAFMRLFRFLAYLGATVVILHHTGKAETSKQYRGSSDIKAAVDTAYLLARASERPDELGALSLTCFKARLSPGQNFGMKFVKGQGFLPGEAFNSTTTTRDVVAEILEERPHLNQTEIVRLANAQGFSKAQIEKCLKNGNWDKSRGPNNSTCYSLPRQGMYLDE